MKVEPGTRLGPYEIVAPLGAGGMGEVWKARDTRLDRSVALKVLPEQFRRDANLRARFDREAKTISQLNHPHICTLHDVGDDYLVMELLEGETLADRIARGPLAPADVIRFGSQIAAALDTAHRRGVVHRDLKPGNVMITKSGAKLLDFGLARGNEPPVQTSHNDATEHRPLTTEGTILGTFQYMAPEQLEGANVDHRADIFTLGALLYEMATGRRAFEGKSKTSLIAAIVAAEPRPMREAQPLAPLALERVVARCLEKDADERWQSAADVRHALLLIGESSADETVARPRNRWLVPALIASMLAFAALAAYFFASRTPPREERIVRASLLPPAGQQFAHDLHYALSISPDDRWITFRLDGDDTRLWVRRIDSGETNVLPGTERGFFPMWSPDSREIAFFNGEKLKRVRLDGAPPRTICTALDKARRGSWGASGDIVFSPDSQGGLVRVSAAGGTPVPLTKIDKARKETTHRWATFLPDQRHFLYFAGNHDTSADSEEHAVFVSSLDEPSKRKLVVRARSNAVYTKGHLLYALEGVLVAQPFDTGRLETTGEPFPVANAVHTDLYSFLASFAVAGDGTLVYRSAPDLSRRELMWLGPAGVADATRIGEPAAFDTARLSADGRYAAMVITDRATGFGDIWLEDLVSKQRSRLMATRDLHETDPVLSPDNKRIAYSRSRGFGGGVELVVADLDGSNERIFLRTPATGFASSWSNDGTILMGSSWQGKDESQKRITRWDVASGRATVMMPGWNADLSPDGKWFVYSASEGNDPWTWVARASDGSKRRKISRGSGWALGWSADKIMYANGSEIRTATVSTAGDDVTILSDEVNPIRPQDGVHWLDSRDGKQMIAVVQTRDPADRALTLISNFARAGK